MYRSHRTPLAALTVSLCLHAGVGILTPVSPEPKVKQDRVRRVVARTLPKPPPTKPKPSTAPLPAEKTVAPPKPPELPEEKPAAVAPTPQPNTKRAPKRRSGRSLTSKRKRTETTPVAPGSGAGGPVNIGNWDPSGVSGPGPIDPNGDSSEGDRVERPPIQTRPRPATTGGTNKNLTPKQGRPRLRPAVPIYRPTPRWPQGLIKSGPITVTVRVRIDKRGNLTSAKALGSAPKLAKKAAVAFVKTIRWRPGRLGNANVKSTVAYTVKFRP